jgi:hypothetical protein
MTTAGPGAELTRAALDAEMLRAAAHVIELTRVTFRPLDDRYVATCSCRTWAAIPARRADVLKEFDQHLAAEYADREKAQCFCGRLLIRSPFAQRPWYHARREEFFGHGGIPAADVASGCWREGTA